MLDRDLAGLYGVETKQVKRAVRRNIDRFPKDFMFELTKQELTDWRCQFGTSNSDKMGLRYTPMAFTKQGALCYSPPCSWLFVYPVKYEVYFYGAPCSMPLEKVAYGRKSKIKGGVRT